MNEYDVKRLAQVLSIQAEIEGMKSENMLKEQIKESPSYGYSHFSEMADILMKLGNCHNDQL
ncbi:MAG: hypothetical protein ACEQSR_01480 [Candidatus Methylacidiphilales bacterium]